MAEIVQLSPLFFGPGGMIGGGERYPLELARALAAEVPTRLVSFAPAPRRLRAGPLSIHLLPIQGRYRDDEVNPLSGWLAPELLSARIVHAHQYESVVTNLACVARLWGARIYVTEHGGRGPNFARRLRLHRLVTANLPVSAYSAADYPQFAEKTTVIHGGVDPAVFSPGPESERSGRALFVGRLIPMKGVDRLISALPNGVGLDVIGPRYDPAYFEVLGRLAAEKTVAFHHPPPPGGLVAAYRQARVLVLASGYHSPYGPRERAELFPLVLLEAMACGTPVIATRVGGMPELVQDGVNGFIVEPDDLAGLGERIAQVVGDDALWRRLSANAVSTVRERFTWPKVAQRCLRAYGL